jgi:acetolactate synthase small subunit
MHLFKVTLRVRNEVGVLARITTRLRKFKINIRSLDVAPIDEAERFSDIHMTLQTEASDVKIPLAKTEQLVPVISSECVEI